MAADARAYRAESPLRETPKVATGPGSSVAAPSLLAVALLFALYYAALYASFRLETWLDDAASTGDALLDGARWLASIGNLPALLAVGLFAWVVLRGREQETARRAVGLVWSRPLTWVLGFGLGLLSVGTYVLVQLLFAGWRPGMPIHFRGGPTTFGDATAKLLSAVFMAPVIEEFLFRGYLFAALRARWSDARASVAVTALFVLGHLPIAFALGWIYLASVAVSGALYIALRRRTESLLPGIAGHMADNWIVTGSKIFFP